jgi:hypothetical protein
MIGEYRINEEGKIQNPKAKIQGNFKIQPSSPRMALADDPGF